METRNQRSERDRNDRYDVAVVGGGLGGLVAAAAMARAGLDVVLLERASSLGGRAGTHESGGFSFNEGAHAFYAGGAAARVLAGLGVRPAGRKPPPAGLMVRGGAVHTMPSTLGALLTTGLLGAGAKLQGARIFARLASFDAGALASVPWSDWVAERAPDPVMREALEALVRVATYANAPAAISAGATISQLRLAQRPGVAYLDGGWLPMVRAVAAIAHAAGASLRTQARVTCASRGADGWTIGFESGAPLACRAVVLATGPAAARSIVASEALASWAARAVPARAACLDVALSRLPEPRATFALGVDRPLYLSVHSRTAHVAPPGAALVSTMKYLPAGGDRSDAARDLAELEAWLDLLQPGWRGALVERRWLPSMVATNAIALARDGGLAGRPGPRVPDAPGVFVVGDWVGDEGMLLDASLASAERAASMVVADLGVAKVA
jgi:phytoene dehydrogenase-like protein